MTDGNENAPRVSRGATRNIETGRSVARADRARKLPGRRLARRDGHDLLVQVHPRTGGVRLAISIPDAKKPAGERVVHFVFVDPHELAAVRQELDRALAALRSRSR